MHHDDFPKLIYIHTYSVMTVSFRYSSTTDVWKYCLRALSLTFFILTLISSISNKSNTNTMSQNPIKIL